MDNKTADIYSRFRHENWEKMDMSQRLNALQELENISAAQNHSTPQKITAKELEGANYGYFDGKEIVVNKHILENSMMVKNVVNEETGETEQMCRMVADANIQMMDTIFHEDYHSFQEQAVSGAIPAETLKSMGITEQTLHNWQSNNSVLNYVDPEVDGCLYRIQGLEQSAFAAGESRTQEAFRYLNETFGEDPNFGTYLTSINNGSYAKNLNAAQLKYGDPNIQNTLQGKMNERYYLENVQYSNKVSAQNVEKVLDTSMMEALKSHKEETGTSNSGGPGHSNYGGFGANGVSPGLGNRMSVGNHNGSVGSASSGAAGGKGHAGGYVGTNGFSGGMTGGHGGNSTGGHGESSSGMHGGSGQSGGME